jgi:hypothetical protein
MVNILKIQEENNKKLLEENKILQKQLVDKEQQVQQFEEGVKLRILKTVHRIVEGSESSTNLMLLKKFT